MAELNFDKVLASLKLRIDDIVNEEEFEEVLKEYTGKDSLLSAERKKLSNLSKDDKKIYGEKLNNVNNSITSNITRVKIRRNLNALINQFAQYELCFGNKFNVKPEGLNIKSTGFRIQGESETVFITDTPNDDKLTGVISIVKKDEASNTNIVVVKSAGTEYALSNDITPSVPHTSYFA